MNRRQFLLVVLLALGAGSLTGCSRSAGSVTGRVTFQGTPLRTGTVLLYCEDKQIIHGLIGVDGTYQIPNVPPGRVRVTVRAPARQVEAWTHRVRIPPAINGPSLPDSARSARDPVPPVLPARYEVPEESGLAVTVAGGVTVFDIPMTR